MSILRTVVATYTNWRAVNKTADALYRLTPRQLEDIGLTTWEIPVYLEGLRAAKRVVHTTDDVNAYAVSRL